MKIRMQLIISVVVFIVAILIIGASIVVTNQQVDRLNRQQNLVKNIQLGASELGDLSNDYILYHGDLQLDRWNTRYARFSEDISDLNVDTPEQQMLVTNIKGNQQRLKSVFDNVVSTIKTENNTQGGIVNPSYAQVSWDRIAVQTRGITFDASRLAEMLDGEESQVKQTNYMLIFTLIGAFTIFLLVDYFLIFGRTIRSINILQEGTKVVGSGNLDHSIKARKGDEVGELAEAFNQMTNRLKTATASKADLENEIAKRKQAEEKVSHLASFPTLNPSPVIETDLDGNPLYVNPSALTTFPDLNEKGAGHPILAGLKAVAEELSAQKNYISREVAVGDSYFQETIQKVPDKMALRIYATDTTERKRAEKILRESEERFRNLADHIPNPAWMADADGHFYWYNKQWYDYTGTTLEEMRGWGWQKVHHPDYIASVSEEWQSKLKLGLPFEKIFPLRGKDGNYRWFLTRAVPIKNADGKVVRWLGTNTDITERKQAEEELQRSEERLAKDLAAVTSIQKVSMSYVRDGDLGLLLDDIMEAAIAIAGTDKGTLQLIKPRSDSLDIVAQRGFGQDFIDFFSSVSHGTAAVCSTAFSRGERVVVEDIEESLIFVGMPALDVQRKAGVRAVQSTPIVNRRGEMIGMLSTHWSKPGYPGDDILRYMDLLASQAADIIERKRAEEALKEAKQQAELYLDLMGHDISNMHQIALGQLELARETMETFGRLEGEDKQMIDVSVEILWRSARLINNIRNIQMMRAGEYKFECLDLGDVLTEAVREYSHIPGRDIRIDYTPVHGCPVKANQLLKDIFNNLLDNAVKHCNDPIRIGVGVLLVVENGRHFYRVAVEDNGSGILDERKDEIFNRLSRGDTKARGTGLGLYIVKTLVDGFGGRVWAEDRVPGDPTQGTRFVVCLPVMESEHPE